MKLFEWKSLHIDQTIGKDGVDTKRLFNCEEYLTLRKWQNEALYDLKDKNYLIINAPTGAGKSLLMAAISWYKIQKYHLRVAISAPQDIIGDNFREKRFIMPSGEKVHWWTAHNMCNSSEVPEDGTVDNAIRWLENPHPYPQDAIFIACNPTWVDVFNRLRKAKRLHLLNNLMFWKDEAHHIKNAKFGNICISNGMGELTDYLTCTDLGRNIQVGLSSACMFRGDKLSMFSSRMNDRFGGEKGGRYNLSWYRYLSEMIYLHSFSFDFLLCGCDYTKALAELFKENRKDIIHIAHPNSKFSTGDKLREAESIISCCQKVRGGNRLKKADIDVLSRQDGDTIILNLVDDSEPRRSLQKKYIRNLINKNINNLDVIIAIGMFKEGADWIYADRSIVVGARNSIVEIIQIMGRLFRDVEGKDNVRIVWLLPFSLDRLSLSEEEYRTNLNEYVKFILASALFGEIFSPNEIISPRSERKNRLTEPKKSPLGVLTAEQRVELKEKVDQILLKLSFTDKCTFESGDAWDVFVLELSQLLQPYSITGRDEVIDIGKYLWRSYPRKTRDGNDIDISDVPFDIIKRTNPIGFVLRYTSGCCGIETWQQLKKALVAKGIESPIKRTDKIATTSITSLDDDLTENFKKALGL